MIHLFNRLAWLKAALITKFFYRLVFRKIGRGTTIYKPMLLDGCEYVSLGNRVLIRKGVRMEVISPEISGNKSPRLIIGDFVNIEQNVHIVCGNNISIGDNVSIAGGVAIVDVNHPYDQINSKIKIGKRIDCKDSYVDIGAGTFIGYGAIILPKVKIGKGVVVGANSVVVSNVPDYCVVAGNPAKIIKAYDFSSNEWVVKTK